MKLGVANRMRLKKAASLMILLMVTSFMGGCVLFGGERVEYHDDSLTKFLATQHVPHGGGRDGNDSSL